ncbi:putative MFS transporter [Acaromyces ingoldii]|uniref:Putative MFS transporter n=1 Tax=Acaromyces ingoldii TaxID=215250 RepID=A0A316YBJ6_9BASI|nr:putative MFS transporter [Acaromyces ingoldii]PWN86631.1 putative MFS transporter [Acaromyces ingoldii]
MGTGISSILLHQLPYQFKGLGIISNVIFGLNVLLFVIFCLFSICRYTVWPTMGPTMLFHPSQSLFLGTFAMGFATIVNMCALSAAPAFGSGFATFTWVLWWLDSAFSIVICIGLPFLQFTRHEQSLDKVTGVWFLPVVSTIVASASGGIVATILPPDHARLTLVVSWILWGTGFPMAILLMAIYYQRLAIYKIPPAAVIVSAFLPLGPCGQGAFAILQISSSLKDLVAISGQALIAGQAKDDAAWFAQAIFAATIPMALAIWGLGLVWLVLAASFLIDLALVSKLSFNLGWWGFTFPLGVFCTATTQFGKELNSSGFKILGTVLSLIEVALWLFIAFRTLVGALSGKLFFSPCLAEQGGEPPEYVAPARKYDFVARSSNS